MTTQERIGKIIKQCNEYNVTDEIFRNMLELLVMEARNEELKEQLKQLQK